MSIIYKSQQQQHVNFNEIAAGSDQCCGKTASRSEPSVRSNNNNVFNQSTDSHFKINSNNNNSTYNHGEMVGTQQNSNQMQTSSASSNALRDSNTSYANELEVAKPSLSPAAQTEGTTQQTFPVVIPYINSSYGSGEKYHERKLHLQSPDKVQDLSEYIREHSKPMNHPSSTDGCVIPRSTNPGLFLIVFH